MLNYSFPSFKTLGSFYLTQTKLACTFRITHLKNNTAIFFFPFPLIPLFHKEKKKKRERRRNTSKRNAKPNSAIHFLGSLKGVISSRIRWEGSGFRGNPYCEVDFGVTVWMTILNFGIPFCHTMIVSYFIR